ncbi:uncharacterized protein LOC119772804 [Cyprinodon tularosa]|uniref:uncharacterized protein LOC119772804 n=1 Tax=Cyprinodon tularosa TaxID=77115 RepID=UPI0018E26A76|nr:uncharacterized protein LOC119772804 [Cyprinodon tularosa]
MKCFMFCLILLPFAVIGVQGQMRAPRRHVLIFLNEALGATTERATPAKVTAKRNPVDRPVRDQDSDDLSEMQSAESLVTPGYQGPDQSGSESKETSKDQDSFEHTDPKAGGREQEASRGKTRAGTHSMLLLDRTSEPVQDYRSQEQTKGQGKPQGGEGQTDLGSEEGTMGKSGRATQRGKFQNQPQRVHPDKSRVTSGETSEGNDGNLAMVHNSEETREYSSPEA